VLKIGFSHTFPVITEAHLRLAQANGVFARGDAIELLKLCLINALAIAVSILIPL
jgi:hypothetical protein